MPTAREEGKGHKEESKGRKLEAWKDKDGDHSRIRIPWFLSVASCAFLCLPEPLGHLLNALLASEPGSGWLRERTERREIRGCYETGKMGAKLS